MPDDSAGAPVCTTSNWEPADAAASIMPCDAEGGSEPAAVRAVQCAPEVSDDELADDDEQSTGDGDDESWRPDAATPEFEDAECFAADNSAGSAGGAAAVYVDCAKPEIEEVDVSSCEPIAAKREHGVAKLEHGMAKPEHVVIDLDSKKPECEEITTVREVKIEDKMDSDEVILVGENATPVNRNGILPKAESSLMAPSPNNKFADDKQMNRLRGKVGTARKIVQERHRLLNEATAELRALEEALADRHAELRREADAAFDWNSRTFPWDAVLAKELSDVFKIRSFRPLQREALNATLLRRDVYAILPTGAGKSLIYQLAAVVDRGLTLVITPLIALSADQQKALQALNIRAVSLDSTTSKEAVKRIYSDVLPRNGIVRNSSQPRKKRRRRDRPAQKKPRGSDGFWVRDDMETTILFVTPEQVVRSKRLMNRVEMMYEAGHLARIVVDEAHCCSSWGHDFRSDYRKLGILKRQCPETPIIGLSATSSPETTDDVCKVLEIPTCVVFRGSIDRPNLFYEVREKKDDEEGVIIDIAGMLLNEFKDQCGIVYVLSRKESETYSLALQNMGISAGCYHGDVEREQRSYVHDAWQSGKLQVVVATIAFGLGIDNEKVRFVIHATMASSLEGYYQESGRAGRNGKPAKCILLHRPKDFARLSGFVADKGDGRLTKMYDMYRYASGRTVKEDGSEEAARCRRAIIAASFGETPPPRSADERRRCCDLCAVVGESPNTPVLADVTALAKSVLRIMLCQSNRYPNEKVTVLALASGWGNRGEKGRRMRGNESPADRRVSLSMRLEIVIGLVFCGALEEFHRHTSHAVNAYITTGPKINEVFDEHKRFRLVLRAGDTRVLEGL